MLLEKTLEMRNAIDAVDPASVDEYQLLLPRVEWLEGIGTVEV